MEGGGLLEGVGALGVELTSQTLVSLSLRLKDLLGPVTRVKKKKKKVEGLGLLEGVGALGVFEAHRLWYHSA